VIEVTSIRRRIGANLVENTVTLYELARLSRLGTEKFMLDGRHTGTRRRQPTTLGGSSPSGQSLSAPPDLLKSFVGYWLNIRHFHISFPDVFIGPTSQAPACR